MTKTILIVGGSGFIGSHLVSHALKNGFKVTELSLRKQDFALNIADINQIERLQTDITKKEELRQVIGNRKFNYVINCAGYIDHTPFQEGGRKVIEQHFLGVMNLVECIDRGCLESFIQIGSSDEYGNCTAPQSEDSREVPISPYSLGKAASSHFLQMLQRTESYPATIMRIYLAYGPGQNELRFLPQIIKGCLLDQTFPVSLGEQLRDFCYISDIVDGIFRTFDTPAAKGEIFNLASGVPVSIRAIIESVRELIGKGKPDFGKIAYRSGENMELYANIFKAKNILNWKPHTSLETGLKKTINYYQNGADSEEFCMAQGYQ
jgi:nucleoside-diphosphate-sugar epimerase